MYSCQKKKNQEKTGYFILEEAYFFFKVEKVVSLPQIPPTLMLCTGSFGKGRQADFTTQLLSGTVTCLGSFDSAGTGAVSCCIISVSPPSDASPSPSDASRRYKRTIQKGTIQKPSLSYFTPCLLISRTILKVLSLDLVISPKEAEFKEILHNEKKGLSTKMSQLQNCTLKIAQITDIRECLIMEQPSRLYR